MKIDFLKYQGTGNDFVLIDNRDAIFDSKNTKLISFLCDRRMGIGADGLMLLEKHNNPLIDFTMRYYNSDGNEASMCGNGGRCIAAFAVHLEVVSNTKSFIFEASDGLHEASYNDGIVSIKMTDVTSIEIGSDYYFLNTGVPHYVSHQKTVDNVDIVTFGKKIRYADQFKPDGTNVNIVEEIDADHIKVRTYERGVEDETYSCGTGVVASAIATYTKNNRTKSFNIEVKGGQLKVNFEGNIKNGFHNIWLIGPATLVFKGSIQLQ